MLDLVYKVIHHCPRVVTQNVAHIKFQNEHVVKIDAHYVLMAAISSFMCQDEYPRECVCAWVCVWVWVGGRSVHLLVLSVAFTPLCLGSVLSVSSDEDPDDTYRVKCRCKVNRLINSLL